MSSGVEVCVVFAAALKKTKQDPGRTGRVYLYLDSKVTSCTKTSVGRRRAMQGFAFTHREASLEVFQLALDQNTQVDLLTRAEVALEIGPLVLPLDATSCFLRVFPVSRS